MALFLCVYYIAMCRTVLYYYCMLYYTTARVESPRSVLSKLNLPTAFKHQAET